MLKPNSTLGIFAASWLAVGALCGCSSSPPPDTAPGEFHSGFMTDPSTDSINPNPNAISITGSGSGDTTFDSGGFLNGRGFLRTIARVGR